MWHTNYYTDVHVRKFIMIISFSLTAPHQFKSFITGTHRMVDISGRLNLWLSRAGRELSNQKDVHTYAGWYFTITAEIKVHCWPNSRNRITISTTINIIAFWDEWTFTVECDKKKLYTKFASSAEMCKASE